MKSPIQLLLSILVSASILLSACGAIPPSAAAVATDTPDQTNVSLMPQASPAPPSNTSLPTATAIATRTLRLSTPTLSLATQLALATPGSVPSGAPRPVAHGVSITTGTPCGPEGKGGDSIQNGLKNRIDNPAYYYRIAFDKFLELPKAETLGKRDRKNWSITPAYAADATAVAAYEGVPVSVEGYLLGVVPQGVESTNCFLTQPNDVDWHIWLAPSEVGKEKDSIIVETTGRVRVQHPNWDYLMIKHVIVDPHVRVRISGWLFFDPEHPDKIGVTRATLWEIHPIMKIEVRYNGQWVKLDDCKEIEVTVTPTPSSTTSGKTSPLKTVKQLACLPNSG